MESALTAGSQLGDARPLSACGVDGVGPSNSTTWMDGRRGDQAVPEAWTGMGNFTGACCVLPKGVLLKQCWACCVPAGSLFYLFDAGPAVTVLMLASC